MDKKLRNLLILAGVLVLLCVGYAVAGLVFPDGEEDGTETEAADVSAPLFTVTEDGLTALSFTYDAAGDGEAELWSYTRSADGSAWSWSGDSTIPLSSSVFYNYSSTLATMAAVSVIRDVTDAQLAEFGLDSPVKRVSFTDAAGGAQSFCIGAYNTYNGTYCLYKNSDPTTVYLVSGDFYEDFEVEVRSMVSFDDLPAFEPEALVSLTMTRGDRTVVATRLLSEAGEEIWQRSVNGEPPVMVASDLADSLDRLVGDMDYLVCYSVDREDLPEYGLHENTTVMTVIYKKTVSGEEAERTFTLTLGDTDKYGYYYANPEGTDLTMLLGGSVFSKLMSYDDAHLAAGDAETDTETGTGNSAD